MYINIGNHNSEDRRRAAEEDEMRAMAIYRMMEARNAGQSAQAAAFAGAGGGATTTTTTEATTTTTTHVAGLDFTIEWFMKPTAWTAHPRLYSLGSYPGAANSISIESNGGHLYWWVAGHSYQVDGSHSISAGSWHHVAVTRNNGVLKAFVDGQVIGTGSYGGSMDATGKSLMIGTDTSDSGAYFNGLITNFRWTTSSIYNGAFTPPTSPLTAVSGTKLLLLATDSGSFLTDSSSSPKSVTNNGTATWNSGSPFAGGVGGSISLNGSSQYLSLAASTDWNL